jgi:hypothetical protein
MAEPLHTPPPDLPLVEARAQIMWGEPPQNVVASLTEQGADPVHARALVTQFTTERTTAIRDLAFTKIIRGLLLLLTPIPAYLLVFFSSYLQDDDPLLYILTTRILAFTLLVALFGLCKLINGIFKYFFRATQPGDLADDTD